MKRIIKLWFLNIRDFLLTTTPLTLLAVSIFIAAYIWIEPQPPKKLILAAGAENSIYTEYANLYARELLKNGIEVEILKTKGSADNLKVLQENRADAAFIRGGEIDYAGDNLDLQSLGALFYEPLWVFYRQKSNLKVNNEPDTISAFAGKKINIGVKGSGVNRLFERLVNTNGLLINQFKFSELDDENAAQELLNGKLDAIAFTAPAQSPIVFQLLISPDIKLVQLSHADAYTKLFPFLQTIVLSRGIASMVNDKPAGDIKLLTASTSLLVKDNLHPALKQLLAQAAKGIHSKSSWLNSSRYFPNINDSEVQVNAEGQRAILKSPPFWQEYLPFWASNLLDRMWLVIGGLIVLLLPLSRVVPPLYIFRVRHRIFKWYAQLRDIETEAQEGGKSPDEIRKELDLLTQKVNQINVPLAYTEELFALINNIQRVKKRLLDDLRK